MQIEQRKVGIDAGQRAAQLRLQISGAARELQNYIVQVLRADLRHLILSFFVFLLLQHRNEEHLANRFRGIVVLRVRHNAHNFIIAGVSGIAFTEVPANGIFVTEELAHECLVHHRNVLRSRRVQLADGTAAQNRNAQSFKQPRADPVPG